MMDANNGKPGTFLTTHWSLVLSAGTLDSENANAALESLCRSYWPPIHAYVQRAGHSSESARDLTQQFFARLLEKEWLQRADRNHGRFRNFLLTYLQRFLSDERDRDFALKRGGGRGTVSLEALIEEGGCFIEPMVTLTPEREFERRWALATLGQAFNQLQNEAQRSGYGELFKSLQDRLSSNDSTERLAEVAKRFGLGEGAVRMRLNRWRSRLGELLRAEVAKTVPRAADIDEELRHLLASLSD